MKKSEIKVDAKLGDILDAPYWKAWDYICDKYGLSEWCINEGRASRDDTIKISLEDAEFIGIVEE